MKTQRSNQSSARSPRMRATLLGLLALTYALGPGALTAHSGPAKTKPVEAKWRSTVDGKSAGLETLKTVNSSSGRLFASGIVEPKGKDGIRTITHQQRDPGGIFKKYRREEKVRLGKGIFAFRKNKSCDRIVGLNQKLEPLELAPIGVGPVWDSRAWHTLALWSTSLNGSEELEMAYLDISRRERGKVTATPVASREITSPSKERVSLKLWKLKGLESATITTAWLPDGRLVFASNGSRELMREGFTWEPPPPPPEPEPEPEPESEPGTEVAAPPEGAETVPPGEKVIEAEPTPAPATPPKDPQEEPTPNPESTSP
jgi:hypothetical protein